MHSHRFLTLPALRGNLLAALSTGAALLFGGCLASDPSPSDSPTAVSAAVAAAVPTITVQPVPQFRMTGQIISFSVQGSGTGPLGYQWQRNGVNISGATSPTYSRIARQQDSGAGFRCVVSNASGSINSNSATAYIGGISYQAENATLSGVVTANNHSGYVGSGFGDYVNASNDYIQWTVSVENAGNYRLEFRYANGGSTSRPLSIRVNGTTVNTGLAFPSTGAWTTWSETVALNANLLAGSNTVRATATGSNGPNMDQLKLE